MSKVRTTYWGGTPVYVVDEADERGELREATFFSPGEAKRFAADQVSAEPSAASPQAVQRANRAMLSRIAGHGGPKNLPRTLQGVLNRLAGVMQTRDRTP